MKIIKYTQEWDHHTSYTTMLYNNNNYISSYTVDHTDSHIELQSVYVAPEHRKKGYCIKMLDFFTEETKHLEDVYLQVRKDNNIAIKIYEKYGFEFHSINEEYPNYHWMIKK